MMLGPLAEQVPFDCQAAMDFVVGRLTLLPLAVWPPLWSLPPWWCGVYDPSYQIPSRFCCAVSRVLHERLRDLTFTPVGLSVDAQAVVHKDSSNDHESRSGLVPLQVPKRGRRLWTSLDVGSVVSSDIQVLRHKGHDVVGRLHSWSEPLMFKPGVLHAAEDGVP